MNTEDNQLSTDTPKLTVCKRCHGQGTTVYANTATWHGGIGGDMMTNDVCDKCWGTGFTSHPGPNRRKGEHPTSHVQELTSLREENKRLRKALKKAAKDISTPEGLELDSIVDNMLTALHHE